MYEKYTGLPDTSRSAGHNQNTQRINRSQYDSGYEPSGRSGGSGHSGGGRRSGGSRRKKKLARRRLLVLLSGLALLALLVLAIVMIVKSCKAPVEINEATDTFRSGVYINGAEVSGKTIDEVSGTLTANEEYAINNIAITLSGDGFSKTITGADLNVTSNLSEVLITALSGTSNQVYYTAYTLDKAALAQKVDEINSTLTSPPTDATFTVDIDEDTGKPTFNYIPGVAGYGLDVDATVALVEEAFANGQYQTTITPTLTSVEPTITVDDVKAHTTLIGSFTTTYDYKGTAEDTQQQREVLIPNRAFNVEKAASLINNQVIKPGRTWSFNDTVGDRNEKNGWKEANGIFGGDKFTLQYGGGVCQVSTTLYNALLEAYPYFTFYRSPHSIPSTYVDKGLDATVDTGHIDFKVKNNSEYPVYIFAYISKNKQASGRKRNINVSIYGEALPTGITYVPRTELVSETLPGEDEITETKSLFIGEEKTLAEARNSYVIDVFVDRCLNGEVQESIFVCTDTYNGNPLRKQVGTKPTPTPVPTNTPAHTSTPTPAITTDPQDQP